MNKEKIKISGNQLQIGNTVYQLEYKVLDYITNLQNEINKLTEESTEWEERTYCWQDRAENLQIVLDKIKDFIEEFNKNVSYLRWNEDDYVDYIKKIEELLEEIE